MKFSISFLTHNLPENLDEKFPQITECFIRFILKYALTF